MDKDRYSGILLVDKPKGWTSFDVVAKVRGVIRASLKAEAERLKQPHSIGQLSSSGSHLPTKVKVGHTGTLDPSATGLLVLCLGKYTKKVPDMIRHDKTYEVELTLDATSTTGDQEGVITKSGEEKVVSGKELQKVLDSFIGEQMQIPPAFSAIKVNGVRAYDLARAGKEVNLEPRKCTIHFIELSDYSWPIVKFTCSVSSGTYIRSLVEDIGKKLGTGAYMSELRRTDVDIYHLSQAIDPRELSYAQICDRILT